MSHDWMGLEPAQVSAIAKDLVAARRERRALAAYPGPLPTDLITAYRVQEIAMGMMALPLGGWRLISVPQAFRAALHSDRFAGPIFGPHIYRAQGNAPVPVACVPGARTSVSVELLFEVAGNAPLDHFDWSLDEAFQQVALLRWGVVISGSPLANLESLGPGPAASDFGCALGLIPGPPIPDWQVADLSELRAVVEGQGSTHEVAIAPAAPDTVFEALRFALIHGASRGRPLQSGMLISAGAHAAPFRMEPGHIFNITFADNGALAVQGIGG